jgi:hypothetical protein
MLNWSALQNVMRALYIFRKKIYHDQEAKSSHTGADGETSLGGSVDAFSRQV